VKKITQITIALSCAVLTFATLRAVDPPPAENQNLADRHHVFYGKLIPEPTDAPFGTLGEVYTCLSCHEVDTSSGSNEFIVERDCRVCHGPGNQSPIADPGGPYVSSVRRPLWFDATGSVDPDGTIVFYDWDFGDGTIALNAGLTPSHAYTAAGQYEVTLTVTDDGGLTDTGIANVAIDQPQIDGLDLDVAKFRVTPVTVNIKNPVPFKITLWVENPGDVDGETLATIVGEQQGEAVFTEIVPLWIAPLSGRAKFEFSYLPSQPGVISWSVLIVDDDPDVDTAEATTIVHQR
jgi:hypothetical protein